MGIAPALRLEERECAVCAGGKQGPAADLQVAVGSGLRQLLQGPPSAPGGRWRPQSFPTPDPQTSGWPRGRRQRAHVQNHISRLPSHIRVVSSACSGHRPPGGSSTWLCRKVLCQGLWIHLEKPPFCRWNLKAVPGIPGVILDRACGHHELRVVEQGSQKDPSPC